MSVLSQLGSLVATVRADHDECMQVLNTLTDMERRLERVLGHRRFDVKPGPLTLVAKAMGPVEMLRALIQMSSETTALGSSLLASWGVTTLDFVNSSKLSTWPIEWIEHLIDLPPKLEHVDVTAHPHYYGMLAKVLLAASHRVQSLCISASRSRTTLLAKGDAWGLIPSYSYASRSAIHLHPLAMAGEQKIDPDQQDDAIARLKQRPGDDDENEATSLQEDDEYEALLPSWTEWQAVSENAYIILSQYVKLRFPHLEHLEFRGFLTIVDFPTKQVQWLLAKCPRARSLVLPIRDVSTADEAYDLKITHKPQLQHLRLVILTTSLSYSIERFWPEWSDHLANLRVLHMDNTRHAIPTNLSLETLARYCNWLEAIRLEPLDTLLEPPVLPARGALPNLRYMSMWSMDHLARPVVLDLVRQTVAQFERLLLLSVSRSQVQDWILPAYEPVWKRRVAWVETHPESCLARPWNDGMHLELWNELAQPHVGPPMTGNKRLVL